MSVQLRLSDQQWAARQFGQVELGDARRTRRAVKLAAQMVRHPAGSIPEQTGDWASTKAAYRLFSKEDVTFEALGRGHWERTRQTAGSRAVVLMIQDSTQLNYTVRSQMEGLGPVGDGTGRGLWLQSVLAVAPSVDGRGSASVLGLAHQQVFCGRRVPKGETRTQRKAREHKAQAWLEEVEAVGVAPGSSRWKHVADREADNFGFFRACGRTGTGFLVRAAQDRCAALGHEAQAPDGHLKQLARSLPALGGKQLVLRSRPVRRARIANLLVAASPVTIFPPQIYKEAQPIRCWMIRVWEVDGPDDEDPIEWILLCSEPTDDLPAALLVAEWYSLRWLIEEYHKCLKTGCRIESRQLQHADRLKALLAMCAVVAVRLLQCKQQAQAEPNRPARECVSVEHVQVLASYHKQPSAGMTIRQFWRLVARLGGFLARKGDGEPGWQTIWRGWQKLDLMTLGASLARPPTAERCG